MKKVAEKLEDLFNPRPLQPADDGLVPTVDEYTQEGADPVPKAKLRSAAIDLPEEYAGVKATRAEVYPGLGETSSEESTLEEDSSEMRELEKLWKQEGAAEEEEEEEEEAPPEKKISLIIDLEQEKKRARELEKQIDISKVIIKSRILLQKFLREFEKQENPELSRQANDLIDKSIDTLTRVKLRLIKNRLGMGHDEINRLLSRGVSQEENAELSDRYYREFARERLDYWYNQANESAKFRDTKKFKALHQDLSVQIENGLSNRDKLIERLFDEKDNLDDSELYRKVLNNYIETAGGGESSRAQMDLLRRSLLERNSSKKKRVVDRKASKGRKIRYTEHEKLVGFMVPIEKEMPEIADQLFASLFM